MEEQPLRAYGLSFVSKTKRSKGAPELIISHSVHDAKKVDDWLEHASDRLDLAALTYLGEAIPLFWPTFGQKELDLEPGRVRIGYRNCAYMQETDDEREFRFPLTSILLKETALTIAVLLQGLNAVPRSERTSNHPQLISISTVCTKENHCGHPIHGYVFPAARKWLNSYKKGDLPEPVLRAMRETWRAVAPIELRKYADEALGMISDDGRFHFLCFGNACDVSIYPDSVWPELPEYSCEFSCHNLDWPSQQLTLLAGMAALLQLMEKESS